jgi:hypothetical protein
MLLGSLQGHTGCLTYQWLVNWQQGERHRQLLWQKFPSSPLVNSCALLPSAVGPKAQLQRVVGFTRVQPVLIAGLDGSLQGQVLTTALIGGSGRGSARTLQKRLASLAVHCC